MRGINMTTFTKEEVENLKAYQASGKFHPFTCPNRGDGKHHDRGIDLGALVPTEAGWICEDCEYTQNWAHEFMTEKQDYDRY